jgi:WhiB family transcriptional regulator, redox-sensing transcriptional regulator
MSLPVESWMEGPIACRGKSPEIFFRDKGHFLGNREAIEICNTCIAQLECLQYALDHHIDDGVWGGTGRNERKRILRARRALRLAIDPEPPASSDDG